MKEHRPDVVQFFAPAVVGENIKLAQSLGALVVAQVGSERDASEALLAGAIALLEACSSAPYE